jgi:hypothetical protein
MEAEYLNDEMGDTADILFIERSITIHDNRDEKAGLPLSYPV